MQSVLTSKYWYFALQKKVGTATAGKEMEMLKLKTTGSEVNG